MPGKSWILAAAVFLLCAVCPGDGQAAGARFSIRSWGTENRLSSVTAITQTRDGYLWLGTLYGLVRFDGYSFTNFDENNTPGLDNNRIFCLFEDSRSNLWVGTEGGGIELIKDGRIVSVSKEGSPIGRLKSACEDASGSVWLCTIKGRLLRYRPDTGQVQTAESNIVCSSIIAEQNGPVLRGTEQGLYSTLSGVPNALTGPPIQRIGPITNVDYLLTSSQGGFWCLADGRIKKWKSNRLEKDLGPYRWNQDLHKILAAAEDNQGNLIVGTYGEGIFWFDGDGKFSRISRAEGLSAENVMSLVVDHEGVLWAGTDGGGLNRISRVLFDTFSDVGQRTVQSVCEDGEGGIWLGCNGGGPNAIQHWKDGVLQHQYGSNADLLARSMFVDSEHRVWAGTWGPFDRWQFPLGGLFSISSTNVVAAFVQSSFKQESNTVVMVQAISSVSAMFQARDGRIWVGTRFGLYVGDGRTWTNLTTSEGLSADDVRAIIEDADGNLWIGTDGGGLSCLRDKKFKAFHRQDGLPSEHVSSLYLDGQGVLWIGTSGGLARYQAGKWTRFTTAEGLASNSIGYLLEDSEGFLWIGSNAGLMRLDKRGLNAFAQGQTNSITCRTYEEPDGLPSSECTFGSQPAACRTRDGKLWFPTIKGLASVIPTSLKPNTNPPPVVIESVSIDNQPQTTAGLRARLPDKIIVPASREHLDIQYTSLNLAGADKARFRYRLEGFETRWNEAGNRRLAPYIKLPQGDYRFHVIACNEDGVWNPTGASLAIIVLPPFWKTWWFLSAVVLVLLALVVGVVHYVSTQKLQRQLEGLRQQQALEKERARIARDIHDQLGASLTQVSLLGEMVESDKNSPDEVAAHAQQISQTARDTSHVLDEIVWTVNPSNDTLDGLVNYVCKYAQDYLGVAGVRYRLEAPAQFPAAIISPEVRHNVFLAAKEAITNVVRHAQASTVWVRLRTESDSFILEIQDDGRGIADLEAKKRDSRNGLRNMAKRMEDIGGKFEINPAPERGALIRMTVPLKKS